MATHALASHYHTTASGTKLHYAQTGNRSGSLLLCLHGLGGSIETFFPLLPHLPSTYNIVLVDFPGFGKSPLPEQPDNISIAGHVANLDDLIASLQGASTKAEPNDTVIIGHSLGAIVALQYAAVHTEAISGLALLGPGRAAGHIPAARQRMQDLAEAVRTKGIAFAADGATKSNFYEDTPERSVDPAARQAVRRAVIASNPEAYARTCEAIVADDHKDPPYEIITVPAVFIAGDRDMISPPQRSYELSALLGGMSWIEVVKSGHQPILEDLSSVVRAVEKLLGSVAVCSAAKAMRTP
ncbi:Alpha/Beta hydrolase protein [Paraphoma chrysanthemicola]|uniref:Alpha/Beta hydrolase protein n=1 Tax=Paraphoma chrysanthemicola TaxID=798071 RepID=A0A8K0RJ02_9PLEO|nr:Alpha/Beta hydrolase protein [Paraphoma chrysanthemicola]